MLPERSVDDNEKARRRSGLVFTDAFGLESDLVEGVT